MAPQSGRKILTVIEKLFKEPHRFDFFQAVRILERYYFLSSENNNEQRQAVGHDHWPLREVVRFKAYPAHSFPAATVASLRSSTGDLQPPGPGQPPAAMQVAFAGLTGPNGALPQHYTTLQLARIKEKDYSIRDFFDIFNHRTISLFYRAWEKYRFPIAYERSKQAPDQDEDLFTSSLYCLIGLGTNKLRGRQSVADETFLYYAGHFAHYPRCALSLEELLKDYFGLPIEVEQFFGQWLYLNVEDRSRMPGPGLPLGMNCQLGVNLIIGDRVWDVQSKIRIRLGPLTYSQFCRFMPTGDGLLPLSQLTRTYVGPEFDFDVHPVLLGPETPWCQLSSQPGSVPRLGWNTWIRTKPFERDIKDAVFCLEHV